MTDRLYYTDPHLTEFDAEVLDVRQRDGRLAVVLDRTAFYPTSGGQPFDTGVLGSAHVVDVIDEEDGVILHLVDGEPPRGRVAGRIDWGRRFDHMQQHTGQHVLSAAFDRLHQVRTMSFHLGSASSTIDLQREVTAAEIAAAERDANAVVWNDVPVPIRFVDAGEASSLPLRKESARTGRLRIIDVEGYDVSACGGTHVSRTGAIGIIVISRSERGRGGTRLEFRCGGRALAAHGRLRDTVAGCVQLVPVTPEELPLAIERLQSENKQSKKRVKDLEGRLASYEAEALVARAAAVGRLRLVAAAADLDVDALKTLAQGVTAHPGHLAILCSTAVPPVLVIARAADVPIDCAAAIKALTARFGGRGGGRSELAQAGGMTASAQELLGAGGTLLEAEARRGQS